MVLPNLNRTYCEGGNERTHLLLYWCHLFNRFIGKNPCSAAEQSEDNKFVKMAHIIGSNAHPVCTCRNCFFVYRGHRWYGWYLWLAAFEKDGKDMGSSRIFSQAFFLAVWVVIWANKHKQSLRCSTTNTWTGIPNSWTAKGPGLKSLHRSNPMSNKQRLTVPWPNHSGSSTQMATDEPAKQRMPWETEPGTAKGPSLNIEHVPRRESLGCPQISDNRGAKCFETRLATHVVWGSAPQVAKAEPVKQRMPWETEPGTAKGQSLNFEYVTRQESLGCLQISDNRSAKCFETGLATHVVWGSAPQVAKAEPVKQRMPWETEPGTATGQSPNFEYVTRRESLGCLQISDSRSAKCFKTRLATHVVWGSAPQVAKAEPVKQRMPWETEPGTAKGQSLNFEYVTRQESLGCLQISDNRSAKCFETGLATHVVWGSGSPSSQSRTCKTEDAMGNGAWNSKGPEPQYWTCSKEGISWMSANLWQQVCQVFWNAFGDACGLRFCSSSSQSRTCKTEDAVGNGAWSSKGSEP